MIQVETLAQTTEPPPADLQLVVIARCPLLLPMRPDEPALAVGVGTMIALDDGALGESEVLLGAVTAFISIGALWVIRSGALN